ncbi:Uncharacterised protein [Serratia quinivorans]|uniref:hypothetical protein n=1 Tax=Serratia quinivorans TaxID=137545 RepID=UPI000D948BA7|nr:hypothetical protein [Serratia quinivorans]SPZ59334.1 Uncharacterised protein [Serratia quinivorans]VEI67941.1 Uncharacterised protein [Serratia quinivorans]
MSKQKIIAAFLAVQAFYSNALAAHATVREPTDFQQFLQDRLFAGYNRVTAWLDVLLKA